MEFEILTGKDAAKDVVVENTKLPYPINWTVKWHSAKTAADFASNPEMAKMAASSAHWKTYQRSEVEGEKGENVKVPSFTFAIIGTGFRIVNVDEKNKEYWQSSLCLDSRTDLVTAWNKVSNKPLFSCSYADFKAKEAVNFPMAKYSTSIIAVDLATQTIVEITAGGLLIDALCKDAGEFLGKKINIFGIVTEPPLVFQKSKKLLCYRFDKNGKEWAKTGECFHLPCHSVGVLAKDSEMAKTIAELKATFLAWTETSIKKIGQVVAENAEVVVAAPEVVKENLPSIVEQVYSNPIQVTQENFVNLDDSGNDLPF